MKKFPLFTLASLICAARGFAESATVTPVSIPALAIALNPVAPSLTTQPSHTTVAANGRPTPTLKRQRSSDGARRAPATS